MMVDHRLIEEVKARLAERYTAAELVDLLGLKTEDIIEEWWEYLLEYQPWILEEVGIDEDQGSD